MTHVQTRIIRTTKAPRLDIPVSQAVAYRDLVFVSGQVAVDPETGEFVGGDVKAQTRRVLDNVAAILEEAGSSLEQIVKTTVFLVDTDDFGAFNEAYREYFGNRPPARSTFRVDLAGPYALEIEAVAIAHDGNR
jgi:2-iminobutanoate/2-iminopropanoate deaminase